MNSSDLAYFREWFDGHVSSFPVLSETDRKNICFKKEHTGHVCENAVHIAEHLGLGRAMKMLAETSALFHDVGRFTQYARYGTFKDSVSKNHGLLGAGVLNGSGVLARIPDRERDLVIDVVRYHCSFSMPSLGNEEKDMMLRLIRDADKLDIWRLFVGYYNAGPEERTSTVGQELRETPGYSEGLLEHFSQKQLVPLKRARSLNDFKLVHLSWVFDLNFAESYRILDARQYIQAIASTLPQTDGIRKTAALISEYVAGKMNR